MLADQRREKAHEGPAAAGLHLDQQRLALVQRHAARLPHRLVAPRLGQARLVERMAGLVQHAHEARERIRLVVAGGDADVAGAAAAEGVEADIEAAAVEVEAQSRHQAPGEGLLRLHRRAHRRRRVRTRLCLLHAAQKLGQERREIVEERVDGGSAEPRLV